MGDALGTAEDVVGRRVKALRLARGWSQQELATRMKDQGQPWRQTTVAKTEAADRPIRVNEAASLAAVFGITISDLLTVPIDDYHLASATVQLAEVRALAEAAQQRVSELERAHQHATGQLEAARQQHHLALVELQRAQEQYQAEVKSAAERAGNGEQEHQEEAER
ncbi:helix-turn-helix transcriptional regulator [Streptomyces sp. N50]|uniref:helix-turn-helix domain-containing protein n=1 Tax=Streptomyces sp. N50 TaxID=3081765 RepID=UPI0029621CFE|nr:helix-turn-helix transcriptional regulator [Streptomyces sp. N50]WOX09164.1 helix-turn-helix transcriptional regulator [Streptomyces sp. N50]